MTFPVRYVIQPPFPRAINEAKSAIRLDRARLHPRYAEGGKRLQRDVIQDDLKRQSPGHCRLV